jgi:DNA-binding XRE family transcriptional regulator
MHPDHWLALELGMGAATALVKNYNGTTITPPNCKVAITRIRHRNIRRARQVGGYTQTEAALAYGLTPRQIRNIESAEPEVNPTGSLF